MGQEFTSQRGHANRVLAGADEWVPEVYDVLRHLAGRALRNERASSSLQPTLLVHEAYLRLAAGASAARFPDRAQFLAAASRAMREVLVDHARHRDALKRGHGWKRITLSHRHGAPRAQALDLLEFDDALRLLAIEHERAAAVVEQRVFGGLTVPESAALLGVSPRTVDQDWRFARAWLDRHLRPDLDA